MTYVWREERRRAANKCHYVVVFMRNRLCPWSNYILSGTEGMKHVSDFMNQAAKLIIWASHLKETSFLSQWYEMTFTLHFLTLG